MWIKFCGIVRPEDLALAVELKVDTAGMIAVPGTPRCVSLREAKALSEVARRSTKLTLVFRDAETEYVREMIVATKPDLLQFHGNETVEFAERFKLPYIKAVSNLNLRSARSLVEHQAAFAWIIELPSDDESISEIMSELRLKCPGQRMIIAGNLRVQTVVKMIQRYQPWGVDVSRGIEHAPQQKDHDLMRAFAYAARNA
jgi:phosphoribosylanthranilate isomerase